MHFNRNHMEDQYRSPEQSNLKFRKPFAPLDGFYSNRSSKPDRILSKKGQ